MSDKGSRSGTPKASSRKSSKAGTPKGSKSGTPKGSKSNTPLPTDPQAMEITEEEALAAGACKWFPRPNIPHTFQWMAGYFFQRKHRFDSQNGHFVDQSRPQLSCWDQSRLQLNCWDQSRPLNELLRSVQTPDCVDFLLFIPLPNTSIPDQLFLNFGQHKFLILFIQVFYRKWSNLLIVPACHMSIYIYSPL